MRTVLEPHVLKAWFLLLLESIDAGFFAGENYSLKIQVEANYVIAMVKSEDKSLRETLNRTLNEFDNASTKHACSFVSVYEISYIGFLYLCDEPDAQQQFCQTLQKTLAGWNHKINFVGPQLDALSHNKDVL